MTSDMALLQRVEALCERRAPRATVPKSFDNLELNVYNKVLALKYRFELETNVVFLPPCCVTEAYTEYKIPKTEKLYVLSCLEK